MIDHTQLVPIMGTEKFKGDIIMDKQTEVMVKPLIKDGVYLHDCLIKNLHSKGKRSKHLYTEVDMSNAFDKFKSVDRHVRYKLGDSLEYEFFNSGHCLGSQIKLWFKMKNGQTKTLVYTGDIASKYNKSIKVLENDIDIIPTANCYIFEGTYGANDNREFNKKTVEHEVSKLKNIITERLKQGHRIFFPAFSFMRTEEILLCLYSMFGNETWFRDMNIPIYVDGKLTNTIYDKMETVLDDEKKELWYNVKNWRCIRNNREFKGTEKILQARQCGIYISSSGFIQPKTRSCEYVKNFLGSEKALVVFIGYFGTVDSIAGQIVNTPIGGTVKIDGSTLVKSCDVICTKGFSSHIQRDEIINYWKQINTDRILIHHASQEARENLKKIGEEELMKIGKTTKISHSDKYHKHFVF